MVARSTNTETWKDWLGADETEPDQLFSRQEIADHANVFIRPAGEKPVKAGDLQVWEKQGVLPRPIRRRRDNAQYALYPDWYAYLVRSVRQLQREGYSLEEIRPQVRAAAKGMIDHFRASPGDHNRTHRYTSATIELGAIAREGQRWCVMTPSEREQYEDELMGLMSYVFPMLTVSIYQPVRREDVAIEEAARDPMTDDEYHYLIAELNRSRHDEKYVSISFSENVMTQAFRNAKTRRVEQEGGG